jgi:hypothetical protein
MSNRGIDIREAGASINLEEAIYDSSDAAVTTGTATATLFEMQSDSTLKVYDFNDNTFKTSAPTTPTLALTHRAPGSVNSGVWTGQITTLTGFTVGRVYMQVVSHTGGTPKVQIRKWQYGDVEGDGLVSGTGSRGVNPASGKVPATLAAADASGNLPAIVNAYAAGQDPVAILGALNTAAATGDPGTTTTLVAYLKQLINVLIGSAGVATFPASAVPGDAVSLAEIIRKIYDLRAADTAQSGDAFGVVNNGTYGNSALLSAVQNVQNNTFIATSIPYTLERPDAGSATVNVSIVFADETGAAKNLDSGSPTITLVNDAGTDLSSRLGSITNPATGKYVVPYTNSAGDTIEGLHWDVTGTVNSKSRRMVAYTQIVDTTAVDFTSTDRTNLGTILTRVGTPANATLANDIAAVGTSAASAASSAGSAASSSSSAAASAGAAASQTTAANIRAALGLNAANLDTQLDGLPTAAENAAAVRDVDNTSPAANSLGAKVNTAAGAGAAPSAAAIADAVWDEARTGHTTANTFGKFLDAQVSTISGGSGGGTDWTAEERAQILAWLEATYDKTQLIGSGTLESTSPVMQDGSLRLVRGDDYTDVPLSWTITDYAGPDLTGGSVSFALFPKNGTAAELSVSDGTVAINSTTVTLTVSLTREQTLQLSAPPSTAPNYRFQVRATTADGKQHTNVYGVATVLPELVS